MTQKQTLKHVQQFIDKQFKASNVSGSELDAAEPTPDGLGAWEGGRENLKGGNRWVAEKSRGSRTANSKNTPGTDYPSKITHRQDADFNEIHTDANGNFYLYNVKTDAWDILGDSADIPYYVGEGGDVWAYNVKTGAWDVEVTEVLYDAAEKTLDALTTAIL